MKIYSYYGFNEFILALGFKGKIVWDIKKPDGTPQKLLDVSIINNLGWKNKTELKEGIEKDYDWYKK